MRRLTVILLALLPTLAHAQSALSIPVMSFGSVYYEVFTAISMLMESHAYQNAVDVCLGLGFICVLSRGAMAGGQGVAKALMYLWLSAFIVIALSLKTTVAVQIDDLPDNYVNAIQKVPLSIAMVEHITHSVGYYLSKMINRYYSSVSSTPESLLSTGSAFGLAPSLVADASQFEVADPYLKDSLTHFTVDCVYPQVYNGRLSRSDLLHSNNLFDVFTKAGTNPSAFTVYYGINAEQNKSYGGAGKVESCAYVSKDLAAKLPDIETAMQNALGEYMSGGLNAKIFQDALNHYSGNSPYSVSPGQYLMQSAMLGIWKNSAPEYAATKTRSQMLFQQLAIAQAKENVFENWEVSAATFKGTWGYAIIAIDLLLAASFPFVLLIIFIPPLAHIPKQFVGLLSFVPAVNVCVSMAQAIGTHLTTASLHPFFNGAGHGLTLSTQMFLTKQAIHATSMADWMLNASIIIAGGLCFGFTYAGSKFGADSNAARESAAATDQVVRGNETLDNKSYNNTSANKHNTIYQQDIGAGSSVASIATAPTHVQDYGGQASRLNAGLASDQLQRHTTATHTQSGTSLVATSQGATLSHTDTQGINADHSTQSTRAVSTSLSGSGIGSGAVMAAYKAGISQSFAKAGFDFDSLPSQQQEAITQDIAQGNSHALKAAQAQSHGDMQKAHAEQKKADGFFASAVNSVKSTFGDFKKEHPYITAGAEGAAIGLVAVAAVSGIPETAAAIVGAGSAAVSAARYAGSAIAKSFGRTFGSTGERAVEQAASSVEEGQGVATQAAKSAQDKPLYRYNHETKSWDEVVREGKAGKADQATAKTDGAADTKGAKKTGGYRRYYAYRPKGSGAGKTTGKASDMAKASDAKGTEGDIVEGNIANMSDAQKQQFAQSLEGKSATDIAKALEKSTGISRPKAGNVSENEARESLREKGAKLYQFGEKPLSNAEEQRRADNYDHWTGGSVEKYREGYDRKAIRNEQEKLQAQAQEQMDKEWINNVDQNLSEHGIKLPKEAKKTMEKAVEADGKGLDAKGGAAESRAKKWIGDGRDYLKQEGKGLLLGKGASVNFNEDITGDTAGKDVIKKSSDHKDAYGHTKQAQSTNQTTDQWSVTTVESETQSYQMPMIGDVGVQFMDKGDNPKPRSAVQRAREIHAEYVAKNAKSSAAVDKGGEQVSDNAKSDQGKTADKERDRFDSVIQLKD